MLNVMTQLKRQQVNAKQIGGQEFWGDSCQDLVSSGSVDIIMCDHFPDDKFMTINSEPTFTDPRSNQKVLCISDHNIPHKKGFFAMSANTYF